MINEQRALATLDLALKNAFETLDKYSLWVRTPEDSVTFNLVDAVPTLDSNGTGIFLKPITVPSFAAVRSTIFGPQGTTSERPLYWNLRFKAVNGWIFEKNQADNPTKLTVLVNTFFGANDTPVSITNTNVTENLVSSQLILDENSLVDFNNGKFRVAGDSFIASMSDVSIGVSDGRSKILGTNIVIGSANSAYSALTYAYSKNSQNIEKNSITLGPTTTTKQSTYSMVLRSGSLAVDLSEGKNFQMKMRSSTGVKSLLSAVFSNGGYDVDFIEDGFKINRLYVGDVKSLKITSSDNLQLINDYGSLIFNEDLTSLYGNVLKISSKTSTSIGSKTSVNIGIEDSNGVISKEIVVTKGSVVIPNLYVQKKANYQLSGVKHVTASCENPSVKYIPNSLIKTRASSEFAFEYTKNIAENLYESDYDEYLDTTINDVSGSLKSYLIKVEGSSLKVFSADVTYDNTNGYVITNEYTLITNTTGLELSTGSVYAYDPIIKTFSTPNGMYIMVRQYISGQSTYVVYFTSNGLDFSKLTEYSLNVLSSYDVSVDYVVDESTNTDHIWFAISYNCYGANYWSSDLTQGYTYNVYYLQHTCSLGGGVVSSKIEPKNTLGAYQVATGNNPFTADRGQYGVVGSTCKIVAVPDNTRPYALIMNAFGCASTKGQKAHAVGIMKYSYNGDIVQQSQHLFVRNDAIGNGRIVDFLWDANANTGRAIYANESTLYSWTLSGSTFTPIVLTSSFRTRVVSKLIAARSTTKYIARSICGSNKKAILAYDDSYTFSSLVDVESGNSLIISTNGFMYYDPITDSVKYYDPAPDGVILSEVVSTVQNGNSPIRYDVNGFIVDYFGLNLNEYGHFFTSYVLSKNNVDPFKILNADESTDRRHYIEQYNSDISTLIQSSEAQFTPSKISKELNISYDVNDSIFVKMSNIYDPDGYFSEIAPSINNSDHSISAINFHIEAVSYIAKNRKNNPTGVVLGKYTITNISDNLYSIVSENNNYSGYRIPYKYTENGNILQAEDNQLTFSNMSNSSPRDADLNATRNAMYVTINESNLIIHSSQLISSSVISIKIPYRFIDPTDASYDPTYGVINEFNNVVSIKIPYIFGFRSRCCNIGSGFDGRSNIIFGLTEISDLGGDC